MKDRLEAATEGMPQLLAAPPPLLNMLADTLGAAPPPLLNMPPGRADCIAGIWAGGGIAEDDAVGGVSCGRGTPPMPPVLPRYAPEWRADIAPERDARAAGDGWLIKLPLPLASPLQTVWEHGLSLSLMSGIQGVCPQLSRVLKAQGVNKQVIQVQSYRAAKHKLASAEPCDGKMWMLP